MKGHTQVYSCIYQQEIWGGGDEVREATQERVAKRGSTKEMELFSFLRNIKSDA